MASQLFKTASEIIALGIDDPDLFLAMGLFEDNFGPEMIGDMFTNVVFEHVVDFNRRIYRALGLKTQQIEIKLNSGKRFTGNFVTNIAYPNANIPVILLPKDVLRDLPIAVDWRGVQEASENNREFRRDLNKSVANLWSKKTLESKEKLRAWVLSGQNAFGDLLDMVHGHEGKPYDFAGDKLGELIWRSIGVEIATKHPFSIKKASAASGPEIIRITEAIISQFCDLIEKRDLWRELYHDGKPRLEKSAQRVFYAIAVAYCAANGIDITPEADTGRGPANFKFSTGFDRRVLVEIKLSTNPSVVKGFTKQLEVYNDAEAPIAGYYVVIDVGQLKNKKEEARCRRGKPQSKWLRIVDSSLRQRTAKIIGQQSEVTPHEAGQRQASRQASRQSRAVDPVRCAAGRPGCAVSSRCFPIASQSLSCARWLSLPS